MKDTVLLLDFSMV